MKIQHTVTLLIFLFNSQLIVAQGNESKQKLEKDLQQQLDSLQQELDFPGATLAVILPTGESISLATGLADSLQNKVMEAYHRMLSGSNGKTLFIAAILALHEEGFFELKDLIKKYLGEESWFDKLPNASQITMRMLMDHTSGLEEYYTLGDFMEKLKNDPDRQWEPLENIAYVFDREALFPAGEDWGYADTNYLLLGYIVEKISGKDLYEVIQKKVIEPYDLSNTEPSTSRGLKNLVVGYSGAHSPFPYHGAMVEKGRLVFNPQFEWAGGGFVSNVEDLAIWAKGFYNFQGVSETTRQQIRKGVPAKTGEDHLYGLGMQIRPSENFGYTYGHSGWFPGYITDAIYIPELDLALSVQFNTDAVRKLKGGPHSILLKFAQTISESEFFKN